MNTKVAGPNDKADGDDNAKNKLKSSFQPLSKSIGFTHLPQTL
jgi:hypothetical protein